MFPNRIVYGFVASIAVSNFLIFVEFYFYAKLETWNTFTLAMLHIIQWFMVSWGRGRPLAYGPIAQHQVQWPLNWLVLRFVCLLYDRLQMHVLITKLADNFRLYCSEAWDKWCLSLGVNVRMGFASFSFIWKQILSLSVQIITHASFIIK